MLTIILIILLIIGFIVGLRRGFILQLIHLTSYFIAFILAASFYKELALRLTLWIPYPTFGDQDTIQSLLNVVNAEEAYYNGIAFFVIFFAVKIILQIIGSMLDFVASIPIIKQLNVWAGGILGFLEIYLMIFILLYLASLLPIEQVQTTIDQSALAKGIIKNTPLFSQQLQEMWFN
ncbi:CvpA family protein [Caldibacillus lycopersici]|uniref:CvpA family protein n=1 Tax=Perspicuibacillus lycopersici TaxID=1325689 RepID=A0AAE3IV37_9BACI|nr:CvpA family protein [Perspicuibacillus lycopersici]MCU9614148.1 CvpA family protein [Perspicuibacillus lycopersici]